MARVLSQSPGAIRRRRYGQRQRDGIVIVTFGLDASARLDLVDEGLLDWADMDDRAACAEAVVEWMRVTRSE